ncbi:MAG TPA: 50S ribosomal protein L9 [Phycisphaerales bacterium]|nr:50S ribosomal protein L9 [Phycisphaerales bacterium]
MAKSFQLLLTESVDGLGIVGDVVTVRSGYARNYLLPRELATEPSEERVKALAGRREEAQREMAKRRSDRETMVEKLEGFEITLIRACNDLGHLYGSVTQQDIAQALNEQHFAVKPRDVRLNQTIKRVGHYEVHIRPESDLEATVKLAVNADRPLDLDKIEQPAAKPMPEPEAAPEGEAPAGEEGEAKPKGKKKAKGDAEDAHDEKPAKKGDGGEKGEKKKSKKE